MTRTNINQFSAFVLLTAVLILNQNCGQQVDFSNAAGPLAKCDDCTSDGDPTDNDPTDPVPPTEGPIGFCHVRIKAGLDAGKDKIVGHLSLNECDFRAANPDDQSKKACKSASMGEFLAPTDGPVKGVCMSQRACEQYINTYMNYSDGNLIAPPNRPRADSLHVQFSPSEEFCVESANPHVRVFDDKDIVGGLKVLYDQIWLHEFHVLKDESIWNNQIYPEMMQ